jgi:hypothetical protein
LKLTINSVAPLCACALMFLWALLLGVLKYHQMRGSPLAQAHPYTDIAHRAALLYSFALALVALFSGLSGFPSGVNLAACGALALYFYASVASYTLHGIRADTDNQFRHPPRGMGTLMLTLIAAEIGGWIVLIAGFAQRWVF